MVKPSRTRRSRRKVIPPAPSWPRGEAAILHEVPGGPGVILWQFARDVRLWSATDTSSRTGLFRGGAGVAPASALADVAELQGAVARLRELVAAPDQAQPVEVASAAVEVARWAEGAGFPTTAMEFAEAAAVADPLSADYALLAGRLSLQLGDLNRAVAWYGRAVALARGDHAAYIRAQLGFGEVMLHVGDHARARRAFRRASRVAVKYGRRGYAAQANHSLLKIAIVKGSFEDGLAAAENALERYPVRHPRLQELALDFARLLGRHGYVAAARTLLQQMVVDVQGADREPALDAQAADLTESMDSVPGGVVARSPSIQTQLLVAEFVRRLQRRKHSGEG